MGLDRVELNYQLSVKDYMALTRAMERSVAERLYSVILFVGVGTLGVGLGLIVHKWVWVSTLGFAPSNDAMHGAVLLGMLSACAIFFVVVSPWYWRSAFRGAEHLWRVKFVANESGIDVAHGLVKTAGPWPMLTRVHASSTHLFLFVAARQAYVVPRSAFPSAADELAFYDWARAGAPQAAFTGHGPT